MNGSTILKLPAQLIAEVLRHLDQQQRAHCAQACTAFRSAAALATTAITFRTVMGCNENLRDKCASLTGWLQKHGQAAAVASIAVSHCCSPDHCQKRLVLPVQQLASLRKLAVRGLTVDFSPEAAAMVAQLSTAAVLPQGLSALTELDLDNCFMELGSLAVFTKLQRLSIDVLDAYTPQPRGFNRAAHAGALAGALPGMQELTHLHLAELSTIDPVLACLPGLHSLQELHLPRARCTAASFAALPQTLTKLVYQCSSQLAVALSSSSAPGLAQLTALQWLAVSDAASVDAALLGRLTSLQHLSVSVGSMPAVGLSALSSLTRLQHLSLRSSPPADSPPGSAADIAALTASSQLTYLDVAGDERLGQALVTAQQYEQLFPVGRRLPRLRLLRASMGLLEDPDVLGRMAECCPGLQALTLDLAAMMEIGVLKPEEYTQMYTVELLHTLQLTCLHLCVDREEVTQGVWRALGQLRSLRELGVTMLCWEYFRGIQELTSCRKLTRLAVEFDMEDDELLLIHQGPDGSPPDLWRQLPTRALEFAVDFLERHTAEGVANPATACTIASMAADLLMELRQQQQHMQEQLATMQRQLNAQQDNMRLQRQRHQLEAREQQRQAEQQLQQLRGEVAEMRAMLQTLLPR